MSDPEYQFKIPHFETGPYTFFVPKYRWRCSMHDGRWWQFETAPRWFHRVMQRLILGIKWERIKDE